jgi:hypothetical protein
MDRHYQTDGDEDSGPPTPSAAALRARLEQSRRDVEAGRTVAPGPVLDRMRKVAEQVRQDRAAEPGAARRNG